MSTIPALIRYLPACAILVGAGAIAAALQDLAAVARRIGDAQVDAADTDALVAEARAAGRTEGIAEGYVLCLRQRVPAEPEELEATRHLRLVSAQ